jgi:hypothetical protein
MLLETPPRGTRELRDGRRLRWWVEALGVALFYSIYSLIRNATNADPRSAFAHARSVIHFERALHLYTEQTLNSWALHSKTLIIACNYFYGSMHFVVTIGVAVFLFRKFPDDYPLWRNTLAISTSLALIGFVSFPLMPPRLLPVRFGFVDTLAKYPTIWSFSSGTMSKLSNQFAAMPSVHCCWALWCACVLVPRLRHPAAKILAACYPAFTITVIVFTANHYFIDALGGFAILGIGYFVASHITRAGRTPAAPADLAPSRVTPT